jgi:hypothetical protein
MRGGQQFVGTFSRSRVEQRRVQKRNALVPAPLLMKQSSQAETSCGVPGIPLEQSTELHLGFLGQIAFGEELRQAHARHIDRVRGSIRRSPQKIQG